MSGLWEWMNGKNFSKEGKVIGFLLINCLKYSALGLGLWLIVSRFALTTYDWAICFTLYPGFFIGYIGGTIFLWRKG